MLAVIIGRRRQGKSTLALALAIDKQQTTIIYDPNDQYGNIPVIEDVEAWMEAATLESVGRIIATDPIADFERLTETLDGGVWEWSDYTLIVDECSMLMTPGKVHPAMERYARTSPKDVHMILTTHRIVDVNVLFRALATDWFVFQCFLDLDVEYLTDQFGAQFAAECQSLDLYHVNHYWLEAGGVPQSRVWTDPKLWHVDIGRRT